MKKLFSLLFPVLALFMTGCSSDEEPQQPESPVIDAGELALLNKLSCNYKVYSVGETTSEGAPMWFGATFTLDPETNKYHISSLDLECYSDRENPVIPEEILNLPALKGFSIVLPDEGEFTLPDFLYDLKVTSFGLVGKSLKHIDTEAFARLGETVETLSIKHTSLGNDVLNTALAFKNLKFAILTGNEFTGKVPCKVIEDQPYAFNMSCNKFTEFNWDLLDYPYYYAPNLAGNPIEGPLPESVDPHSEAVRDHMLNLQATPIHTYWERNL